MSESLIAAPQKTIAEHESELGEQLRNLRLNQNLDQITLSERAGVSVGALKNLESGQGSTLKTLIAVLRVLGREQWLASVAPIATINPLSMPRTTQTRQRASRK